MQLNSNNKNTDHLGDGIPPGWTLNPASWGQRIPIITLALIGFAIAMYLSLYQWRVIETVWDPFFGDGSRKILLDSWVSQVLSVPDAFLGALGYLVDAVTGIIGGTKRWKTMPWLVVVFGIFVGPFAGISVLLVIFQPVLFNNWCFLCLITATISILMIGPAMDEVLASLQYLQREKAKGRSWWNALWHGEKV